MSGEGPYFFGGDSGIVDFAVDPFAGRIELLLPHHKDIYLPRSQASWSRFWIGLRTMQALPAFVATMPKSDTCESRLVNFYRPYSLGGGQKDVTQTG